VYAHVGGLKIYGTLGPHPSGRRCVWRPRKELLPCSATDRQKIDAFIRRSQVSEKNSYHQTFRRSPNCVVQQTINVTVSAWYNRQKARTARPHTTASMASQNYNLRQRRHNLELPCKSGHLRDYSFIQRMLFLVCYWRLTLLF